MVDGGDHVLPKGKVLPFNLKQLMTVYIMALAEELELSTRALTDEVRQLIVGN